MILRGPAIDDRRVFCLVFVCDGPLVRTADPTEELLMDTVRIFDTTLRDGEQSPGATLTRQEKIEIARHLEQMGVDIIEAGFPISSEGDFESVKAIAGEIGKSTVCGLSRCTPKDVIAAGEAVKGAARPRIHVF